ncbi:MAG: RDD family protein [Gammaproteobacteria bacterium]|nr:RDD family protein [Gammaproteobacteria bacterium]
MFADAPRAGVLRRLAAIVYDLLVVIALLMFAMTLALLGVASLEKTGLISLVGYQDSADYIQHHAIWFQLYLVVWVFWFYLYFWCKAGQTLGMRAWRLLLLQQNGQPLTLKQAFIRALTALGGIGNFWVWVRFKQKLALQDQLSGTMMVELSKEQSRELNLHRQAK